MTNRMKGLEQRDEVQSTITPSTFDTSRQSLTHEPSERWADNMDGKDVPMYDDAQYEDDEDKNSQGTKVFSVSAKMEVVPVVCLFP